jgi:isopenicillin-N N-acyltransferase-like protein
VDWVMDAPFRNYPQITVYHPTTGHNFVTIGFTGFIGSISAINDQQVVISASNVQFPDESFGSNIKNGPGLPFVFLVREIAQFDNTFKNAEERIISTPRTLNLILGLGDGKIEKFNAVQYSRSITNFMDDTTPLPACAQSENIHNVVYIGLDWCCPGYTQKLAQQLLLAKDTINPNSVKETVLPKTEIGSVQSVIFNVIGSV